MPWRKHLIIPDIPPGYIKLELLKEYALKLTNPDKIQTIIDMLTNVGFFSYSDSHELRETVIELQDHVRQLTEQKKEVSHISYFNDKTVVNEIHDNVKTKFLQNGWR